MTVHIVTCNNIEAEGEVQIVGVFASLDTARVARRLDAEKHKEDLDGYEDTDARWDVCGNLVVYEIHSEVVTPA